MPSRWRARLLGFDLRGSERALLESAEFGGKGHSRFETWGHDAPLRFAPRPRLVAHPDRAASGGDGSRGPDVPAMARRAQVSIGVSVALPHSTHEP